MRHAAKRATFAARNTWGIGRHDIVESGAVRHAASRPVGERRAARYSPLHSYNTSGHFSSFVAPSVNAIAR